MGFNPDKNHRRSIRLKGYDYKQPGAYFVTICTQNRECLFGDIVDGTTRLNDWGQMVQSVWNELPQHYPGVDIDAFVVMPNHIHGIIVLMDDHIVGATPRGCPVPGVPGQAQGPAPTMSLADVVHRFKSLTTARFRHDVIQNNWHPFHGRLWQRNYYEHVIRNESEWDRIREYIAANPAQWDEDINNPKRIGDGHVE
ncbi:MAG: transposase, partial [Deltaproteobacteria bacterium]|nr:transposase [Deltaproteobacteria bacterium]